jgi:hypothetical protein
MRKRSVIGESDFADAENSPHQINASVAIRLQIRDPIDQCEAIT